MKTKITDLFGVDYPIVVGGIHWISTAEFAAAVSNAGGLGIIAGVSFSPDELREEIRRARELTDKPIGVNISMLPEILPDDQTPEYFQIAVEEGVAVVETAGRNPQEFVPFLKEAGVKLIHKVPASEGAKFARKAEGIGADAVTVVGFECAGHPGTNDVTTMMAVARAVEEVDIPVLAGGGICDARTFVAALALGAEGVLMGTRLLATHESTAHPKYKEWIVNARETDTVIIERSIQNPRRVMRNATANEVLEMENKGATLEELMTLISGRVGRKALFEGDLESGTFAVGQAVGLIKEVKTVKEVLEEIVQEAEEVLSRLNGMLLSSRGS